MGLWFQSLSLSASLFRSRNSNSRSPPRHRGLEGEEPPLHPARSRGSEVSDPVPGGGGGTRLRGDDSVATSGGGGSGHHHTLRRGQSEAAGSGVGGSASLARPASRAAALRRCDTDRIGGGQSLGGGHRTLPNSHRSHGGGGPDRFTGTLPGHRSGANQFYQGNPDCIPMTEYTDHRAGGGVNGSTTLSVPPETWRSSTLPNGGTGGGGGGRAGRYQYDQTGLEEYNNGAVVEDEYGLESTDYYPDDRRTCKTGYIKYNSLSAAKY